MARKRGAGALARDLTAEQAAEKQAALQSRIDRRGGNAPKLTRRLNTLNERFGALASDPGVAAGPTMETVDSDVNSQIEALLPQVGQGVDLNALPQMPQSGDYLAARQRAFDNAMAEFERTQAPQFAQQEQAFNQRMADKGIAPGSEAWNLERKALLDAQGGARQSAMSQAYQLGQGEQQQQYNQALGTRAQVSSEQFANQQLPIAGLGALGGLFSGQQQAGLQNDQQSFLKELEALRNKYTLGQIAATPRGGSGTELSMADRFALMDRESQNRLALLAAQAGMNIPESPSVGTGIASGLATGIGVGIGSGLA